MQFRITLLISAFLVSEAFGDDWYRWRGPNLNGISQETGWLDEWPKEGPPIVWKATVGTGFSSMSVSQGRLYTMGNENDTDSVFCFDAATGKRLWKHSYECPLDDKYFEGGPTSTVTVDGERVFALSRQGHLFCFEAAGGKVVWSKNIQQETRAAIPDWGFAGSPLVHENLLLLNVGDAGLALEKTTGKTVWSSADTESGYSTPVPFQQNSQWYALLASAKSYVAVHVQTGKELWRYRWLTSYNVNAADPIRFGDHVFISSGYNKGAALLKTGEGEPAVVWKNKNLRNQCNSSVLLGGFLYGIDGDAGPQATLNCVDFMTSEIKWKQSGLGSGALMAADGKLIVLSDRGELIIAKASPEAFKPTARAQVLGGKCWTTPVLAQGRIYCRNARGDVVCIDVRPAKRPE